MKKLSALLLCLIFLLTPVLNVNSVHLELNVNLVYMKEYEKNLVSMLDSNNNWIYKEQVMDSGESNIHKTIPADASTGKSDKPISYYYDVDGKYVYQFYENSEKGVIIATWNGTSVVAVNCWRY